MATIYVYDDDMADCVTIRNMDTGQSMRIARKASLGFSAVFAEHCEKFQPVEGGTAGNAFTFDTVTGEVDRGMPHE